ncbi:hypothetical protein [Deinococcus radiophilus]|uniref:hypothetical protein n=1 Tax=Deinococcus radiophilus TaxID=32062 RepID=UPI0036216FB2
MSLSALAPVLGTDTGWTAAPIIIPLGTALLLLLPLRRTLQAGLSIVGTVLMLLASVYLLIQAGHGQILTTNMGGWPAPFGITMVADRLGAWMSLLTSISAVLSVLYAAAMPDRVRERHHLFALMQFLFAGVQISFLTGTSLTCSWLSRSCWSPVTHWRCWAAPVSSCVRAFATS